MLAPTMTEAKSPEELLQERQEFMGETDRSPEALFALAQAFNTLANTPGTLLQGVAAGSGQAAQLLAPIVREQELLDQQMRSAAFDRSIDLAERLQGEKRDIAISALTQAQKQYQC